MNNEIDMHEGNSILDLMDGKILNYTPENFEFVNQLAVDAAKLKDNCLGICYAFGNSISLMLGEKHVSR